MLVSLYPKASLPKDQNMSEHLSPLNKGIGGGSHKLDAGNGESRTSALLRAAAMASTASSGSNTTSSRSAPNVAMASSMTAARSNASSLLDSSLTPEQKLYVAAHMGAMDPFRGNSASTLLNAEQQQHLDNLSALIAQQQRIEEARHALKIDALRARAAATVAASARLQGLGGGLGLQGVAGNQQAYLARLMKESPSMLFPTDFSNLSMPYSGQASLPQTNTVASVASLLRPSTQMESQPMSLPLPPDSKKKGRGGTFPMKLHQMLADLERQKGGTEIASFLPHGRAFAIHKPREFVKHVMPKYFRQTRFSSFQRQLNLYDFHRITEGVDRGAYYHLQFQYGQPQLAASMKRRKIKGVKKAKEQQEKDDHSTTEEMESITDEREQHDEE